MDSQKDFKPKERSIQPSQAKRMKQRHSNAVIDRQKASNRKSEAYHQAKPIEALLIQSIPTFQLSIK